MYTRVFGADILRFIGLGVREVLVSAGVEGGNRKKIFIFALTFLRG